MTSYPCPARPYSRGGTDIFIQFREGLRPDFVIDLNGIAELEDISLTGNALTIGAGMRHSEGACYDLVEQHIPGVVLGLVLIWQYARSRNGYPGGNLMARRARYEGPILASALEAELAFWGRMESSP